MCSSPSKAASAGAAWLRWFGICLFGVQDMAFLPLWWVYPQRKDRRHWTRLGRW
jgi:hypothetical protein